MFAACGRFREGLLEILGKGAFGAVYKTRAKNEKYAFKFITSPSVKETKRETIPLLLWHENIININSVWQLTNRNNETIHVPSDVNMPVVAIQLELCDNTLRDEIYKVSVLHRCVSINEF